MAAQKGRDFLLKVGTASGGTTVAGMRTTSLTVNGETVDVTNKDSAGARTLLAGAGVSSMSLSAAGILSGSAQATTLLGYSLDRSLNAFGIIFDNGDAIDGSFQVTQYQAGGEYNKEQTFSITLESSGALTVTAA